MATRFVTKKTSNLYEAATGRARHMVLIFGDEVKVTPESSNGRKKVSFRNREGWMDEDDLGTTPALEVYFIDVGQGDSTFVVTPGRKTILIDGGKDRRALGFLAWKYRLDYERDGIDIDLLVLSHADEDHLGGLTQVAGHPKIRVRKVIHSGIATFQGDAVQTKLGDRRRHNRRWYLRTRHDTLGELASQPLSDAFEEWREALSRQRVPSYRAVDSSTGLVDIGDGEVRVEVLGPRLTRHPDGSPMYRWFTDEAHTINGHSVSLRLVHGDLAFLFPGDVNARGSRHLMEDPAIAPKLSAHVFKAPHHGSKDYQDQFISAVNPQISVISSGDEPDHGHPRAEFIGRVGQASRSETPLVFSTEIAATFVETDEKPDESYEASLAEMSGAGDSVMSVARRFFKRRLHGMINVRSDGRRLYAARRVSGGAWWESYGPLTPAPPAPVPE